MDKRYQIFVSSTFRDLQDERQAALKAILELDHMPAGMELFPASDDTAWQLICDVIDGSDYYVLVIGGRYGSLDEEGLGYTEREYEYARETRKPVIALLHRAPENLPRERTDTDPAIWERLQRFRERVEGHHTCKYWLTVDELKASLIVALTAAVKTKPGVGWIRVDQVPSEADLRKLRAASRTLQELQIIFKQGGLTSDTFGEHARAIHDVVISVSIRARKGQDPADPEGALKRVAAALTEHKVEGNLAARPPGAAVLNAHGLEVYATAKGRAENTLVRFQLMPTFADALLPSIDDAIARIGRLGKIGAQVELQMVASVGAIRAHHKVTGLLEGTAVKLVGDNALGYRDLRFRFSGLGEVSLELELARRIPTDQIHDLLALLFARKVLFYGRPEGLPSIDSDAWS